MKPIWAIEARVDGLDVDSFASEVSRQGMEARVVRHNPNAEFPHDITGAEDLPRIENVIFTGSLDLIQHIQASRDWTPTGWCDFESLSCSEFCRHFESFILNPEYRILSIEDALKQQNELYSSLAVDHKFFVRPNSVGKLFTGQIVDIDSLDDFLTSKTKDNSKLVFFAKPKKIAQEWRLFIWNDQIVDGCQYFLGESFDFQPGVPDDVRHFVASVFSSVRWRPHPLFVMGICRSNSQLFIVELNSYNCSGLLKCDISKFVAAATTQAVADSLKPRLGR
ncbi:ATP-grasp domain-containing protein [bacterium]|nr:ATP-grasp domain-containing protein [bacterium]